MDDCIELKAGIKQLLDYEAALICFEHIQHKVKLADLFEQAKAEAFQAGRKAGLGETITAIEQIKTNWQDSQERGRAMGVVVYEGALVVAANEILKAVEALAGGGE